MNGNMKNNMTRKEVSDYFYAIPLRSKNQLYALCNLLETYNIDTSGIELNLIRSVDGLTMFVRLEAYVKEEEVKTEFISLQRVYFKMYPYLTGTKETDSTDRKIKFKTNLTLLHSLQSEESFLLN